MEKWGIKEIRIYGNQEFMEIRRNGELRKLKFIEIKKIKNLGIYGNQEKLGN